MTLLRKKKQETGNWQPATGNRQLPDPELASCQLPVASCQSPVSFFFRQMG